MHKVPDAMEPHFRGAGDPSGGATEQVCLSRFWGFFFLSVCLFICFENKQLVEKLAVDMRSSAIVRYVRFPTTGGG